MQYKKTNILAVLAFLILDRNKVSKNMTRYQQQYIISSIRNKIINALHHIDFTYRGLILRNPYFFFRFMELLIMFINAFRNASAISRMERITKTRDVLCRVEITIMR